MQRLTVEANKFEHDGPPTPKPRRDTVINHPTSRCSTVLESTVKLVNMSIETDIRRTFLSLISVAT